MDFLIEATKAFISRTTLSEGKKVDPEKFKSFDEVLAKRGYEDKGKGQWEHPAGWHVSVTGNSAEVSKKGNPFATGVAKIHRTYGAVSTPSDLWAHLGALHSSVREK